MPKLTGLETVRRLRQFREVLPCILISGDLDEAIIEQARQADVFSILSKPLSIAEVTGAVGRAMRLTYDWPR